MFRILFQGQNSSSSSHCPLDNSSVVFSLSFSSHSAWNDSFNCSLSQCNNNGHDCRSSEILCFDYRTMTNMSYCAPASRDATI